MTRKSRREIENALDDVGGEGPLLWEDMIELAQEVTRIADSVSTEAAFKAELDELLADVDPEQVEDYSHLVDDHPEYTLEPADAVRDVVLTMTRFTGGPAQ